MSVSVIRYSIVVLYIIALAILSLMSGEKATKLNPWDFSGGDKLAHLVAYSLLSFLIMYALKQNLGKKKGLWVLIASIMYGIGLECLQYILFTGRHFEFLDIIANIIGCTLGILIFNKLNK